MSRHLPNQNAKFVSQLDRLDQHLGKNSSFDSNVKEALPGIWLPYFQDDALIVLDLSDLARLKTEDAQEPITSERRQQLMELARELGQKLVLRHRMTAEDS